MKKRIKENWLNILIVILILSICFYLLYGVRSSVAGTFERNTSTATRTLVDGDNIYVINYLVNYRTIAYISSEPPVRIHYPALISVYKIKSWKTFLLCRFFKGVYTEKGCFEDNPKNIIKRCYPNQIKGGK